MNKKTILLSLLGALLIGGLVWLYYANTELKTETIDIGYHGKARQNSFFAVQRYTEKKELSVSSRAALPFAKIYDFDTLLLPVEALPLEPSKLRSLRDWLEAGGTLITGFSGMPLSENSVVIASPVRKFLGINKLSVTVEPLQTKITLDEEIFELETQAFYRVEQATYENIQKDPEGNFVFGEKYYGSGQILLFSSLKFLENKSIQNGQNIDILDRLLDIYTTELLIVYRAQASSIWTWLWANARLSLLLLALVIILWILNISKRFGPMHKRAFLGSRKIMEHIEAMGQYLWSGKHSQELLETLQKNILDRVKKAKPNWLYLEKNELYRELAEQSKLTKEGVSLAMEAALVSDEDSFYTAVKTLKKIKDSL
jgi:hypothetical protein